MLGRRQMLGMTISAPLALTFVGCEVADLGLKALSARLTRVALQDLSLDALTLALGLAVTNPNLIGLPELGLALDLTLAERPIAQIATNTPFDLDREATTALDLAVQINTQGLIRSLVEARAQGTVAYDLSGSAMSARLGGLSLPVSAQGFVPLS